MPVQIKTARLQKSLLHSKGHPDASLQSAEIELGVGSLAGAGACLQCPRVENKVGGLLADQEAETASVHMAATIHLAKATEFLPDGTGGWRRRCW